MSRLAHYLQNLQRFGIQPGLERIRALLESAGNPQNDYPILLVGGTNGKGSTCEFAARLLAQNGRKIGLYTSPHLYDWNERIRILPGEGLFEGAISDADLDALFFEALPHIEKVAGDLGQPTEFEVVTFLGLWHFARQNVDAAVVEVGLGGKWDATNVTEPIVSVVTHVALDHMDRLGNTVEEIAADKVHIARAGRPFITAEWKPEVLEIFWSHRRLRNDSMTIYKRQKMGEDTNFRLAYLAARTFCHQAKWKTILPKRVPRWNEYGWKVLGRAEKIAPNLYIDGANNPEGAEFLREFIELKLKSRKYAHTIIDRENLILVLGILADKDFAQMTQILAPLARKVIATQSNSPRAATASQIAAIARQFCADVEEIVPVAAAVERAKALAAPDDTILVTGSFTTIAEVPRAQNSGEI